MQPWEGRVAIHNEFFFLKAKHLCGSYNIDKSLYALGGSGFCLVGIESDVPDKALSLSEPNM